MTYMIITSSNCVKIMKKFILSKNYIKLYVYPFIKTICISLFLKDYVLYIIIYYIYFVKYYMFNISVNFRLLILDEWNLGISNCMKMCSTANPDKPLTSGRTAYITYTDHHPSHHKEHISNSKNEQTGFKMHLSHNNAHTSTYEPSKQCIFNSLRQREKQLYFF